MGWLDWLFGRRKPAPNVTPPPRPATRTVAIVLPQAAEGAEVYLDDVGGNGHRGFANANGYIEFNDVSPLTVTYVRVTHKDFEPYQSNGVPLPPGNVQVRIGVPLDPNRVNDVALPGLTRVAEFHSTIHGRLRSENGVGPRLVNDGGPWRWKMATAFDALRLLTVGEDPQLIKYLEWVASIGGNGVRVFANWAVTGLDFRKVPNYFSHVRNLCALTGQHGLHLELCGVCDYIPNGLSAQAGFLTDLAAILNDYDHTVLTFGNEPYQNMEDPQKVARPPYPNLLMSRGMCNPNDPNALPYLPSAGFTSYQTVRSDDWMRKVGKDGFEIRNGFGDAFKGTHDATINTEMMGAAETYQPGRRSNRPDEFFMAGVAAAMFTSGATAHGDSLTMQRCTVPGPIEALCAQELFRGIDAVPIDAPTWEYCRPGLRPELLPVEGDPIDSLDDVRIHAMVGSAFAASINYRYLLLGHDMWRPKGVNGWHTVSQDGPYVLSAR